MSTNNLLIIVNSTEAHNQYASYVVAFLAKKLGNVPNVTVYYGPKGVTMSKKGELAKLALPNDLKELVAGQVEGLAATDLPDNLEQLARFEKDQLGVVIASCGTFDVVNGFAKTPEDTSNMEDFIVPVKLPQAWETVNSADKILNY